MTESPRPDQLGEQRTPVAPEPPEDRRSAADPRSEEGARGVAARVPYWLVVIAVVIFALILFYLVWLVFPPR